MLGTRERKACILINFCSSTFQFFLSHYLPKWLSFSVDPNKQNSHKREPVLAQSSRFRFVYCFVLVLRRARSLPLSSGVWALSHRLQLPVIYLCITHSVRVPLAGRLSTIGLQHTDIWTGCISLSQSFCRHNVVTRSAGRAPVLLGCVLKGKKVCVDF